MRIAVIAALATSLSGCGSASRVALPMEASKPASALTESEIREICKQGIRALKNAYGAEVCSVRGLVERYKENASCETTRDSCLATTFDAAKCDEGEVKQVQCDVTVGELERCMNDLLAEIEQLPAFSCSMDLSELRQLSSADFKINPPASCEEAAQKCGEIDFGIKLEPDLEEGPS